VNDVAARASSRPYGREEVVAAVVEAATELFAERGPAAVSLREVAEAADVNLGLIHRHIGSKTDLLAAVLRARPGMVPRGNETFHEVVIDLVERGFEPPPYTMILIRAALDGYDLGSLGIEFPGLEQWTTALRANLAPLDADIRVAFVVAMALGWHAIGKVVLDVVGRGGVAPEDVVRSMEPALAALVTTGAGKH
jgi:AcrR family transcriptional regulator